MDQILVGTSSWADPTLIKAGTFYPPEAKTPEARLRYYCSNFPVVEVDSPFYALPLENVTGRWARWTPEGFIFDVKSFRLFTHHPTPLRSLPPDIRKSLGNEMVGKRNLYLKDLPSELASEMWRRFENALLPLDSAGKLGLVAFQFPPWFVPNQSNKKYVASLKEHLPQYDLSVEFRTGSWLDDRRMEETFALLRENGMSYVCVDEPQGFKSSVKPVVEATSDVAVVRFHGRNAATWEKEGLSSAERFNYLYAEEELKDWLPKIEALIPKVRQVHVLFNNCYGDRAVVNARQLRMLLGETPATQLYQPSLL